MKHILSLFVLCSWPWIIQAELPIPVPISELPATNLPPGIVVPQPTRGGSPTNTGPVSVEEAPKPQPLRQPDYGNRDWKTVPPPRPTLDRIKLRNNDSLDGKFLGWEGGVVRWEHEAAARPIRLQEAGVTSLKMATTTNAPAPAATGWIVRLTNGNLLTGDGLTMNADTVELTTSATGRLRLPRTMVEAVQRDSVKGIVKFRALQWLGDWDRVSFGRQEQYMNQQRWVYRDVELPDCVGVELQIPAPMAPNRNLVLYLFCGQPSRLYADPSYMLSLNNNYLTIQTQGANMMGGGMQEPFQLRLTKGRNTTALGFLVNRLTGRAVLMVDGVVTRTVQLPPLPERAGRGILLMDNLPDEPAPSWLLLTPLAEDLHLAVPKVDRDAIQFANGDMMEGRLESLGATNLVLNSKLGRVELPAERLMAVRPATAQRTEPRRRDGDVAVTLRGGSRLTAVLREFGEKKLVLESELFGKIELARSLVEEVQWGLYEPPQQPVTIPPSKRIYGRTYPDYSWEAGTIDLVGERRLRGTMDGFADGIVYWKHPQAIEPIQFRQGHVSRVTVLDSTAGSWPAAATVKLTNCDRLSGELVAVDGRTLQLRPAYMPALSVPRAMVATIRPNATPDGVLDVVGSPTWSGSGKTPQITVTNNTVLFKPGAGGQPFMREGPLPSKLCLQFDLVDQFLTRNLNITAFGRSQGANQQEGCIVGFGQNMVNLYAFGGNIGWPNTQGYYRDDSGRSSVTATVLIDREQRDMFVFIEGQLLAKWRGSRALPAGNQLSFSVYSGQPTQLRRVVLSEWRGRIEALTNAVPPAADSLLLHDMTRVTGSLTAVREGQAYFTGKEGTSSQGLGRINEMEFNKSNRDQPRRRDGDIRIHLPGGDQLTLSAARWDSTGLLGTSGAVGPVVIPGNAIARVEFRPYVPPAKTATPNYGGGVRQITLDACR
jgi:hypothetical protein